jgi:alpha-glucoside transport system substrate-binding protein
MLRTQTPDVYDQWVSHAIPFNDPRIVAAIDEFGAFAKNDTYVAGGAAAVATTDFRDSPKGLFSSPPQCYMHRQASFIPSFFPEGTVVGQDADFFYFPAYAGKDLGTPVLGAGTLAFMMKDTEAGRAFMEWLKTPIAHEVWMAQSGFVTPFKGANAELYGSAALKKQGEMLANATTFRFDGSDMMPGAVGAGTFWTAMVDYVNGKSAQEVADAVEASWPK